MATPSIKDENVAYFLEHISKMAHGRSRLACIKNDVCVGCGKPVKAFRDAAALSEYHISGYCQSCQDEVFGA